MKLLVTPCINEDLKAAFLFSCYTGLRCIDVKKLEWKDINEGVLTTRIIQAKTGLPVTLTLHEIAKRILEAQKKKAELTCREKVFLLPSQDGCNKTLNQWVEKAKIKKHITWSCTRLSFSILLQDRNIDDATAAYLMGHATTEQVRKTYKRHRPKNQMQVVSQLPAPDVFPKFLC